MKSPVMFRSVARPSPTSRGSRWVPPPPAISPSLISGWPSCASSAAMRMSQHIATSSPPPRQNPWIAATNGVRAASMRCPRRWMPRAEPPLSSCADSRSVGNSEMSAPATNARSPAPLRTIARISSSVSSRASSASSSSSSGAESALTGGWSIVTTATAPSISLEMNSAKLGRLRRLRARELLAERRLPELADRRLRDFVHELEPVGEPPLREARGEELAQLLVRDLGALLQHDDRERPLRPLVIGHGDDRRLGDGLVPHERVLERDRRDPLAARLDEVLGAILHLDEAVGVDAHDVACPEPAVVRPAVG